jgi:hypothetical protein
MKITLDNKRTSFDFAELVEGEAFMTMDGASIYVYCTSYYQQDNQLYHVVMKVTENGLIPMVWESDECIDMPVVPLEVQAISFSNSTVRNTCSFCD